jgi:hypothetical protein
MIMPFCNKCGAKIQDDSVYCEKCGTRQSVPTKTFNKVQDPKANTVQNSSSRGWLWGIIAGFALIIIIIVISVNNSGDTDKYASQSSSYTPSTHSYTPPVQNSFDVGKIDVTAKSSYDMDVYFNGNGGPSMVDEYITIKNSNDVPISVSVGFDSPGKWNWAGSHGIFCGPTIDPEGRLDLIIGSHESRSAQISCGSGSGGEGYDIGYKLDKNVEITTLAKVILNRAGDGKMYKILEEIPVKVTEHCISEYDTGNEDDCIKLSESWGT